MAALCTRVQGAVGEIEGMLITAHRHTENT